MEWYVRITEKKRKEIDVDLLVQAVLALREQLDKEAQARQDEDEVKEENS
jgi:hypothetical protein